MKTSVLSNLRISQPARAHWQVQAGLHFAPHIAPSSEATTEIKPIETLAEANLAMRVRKHCYVQRGKRSPHSPSESGKEELSKPGTLFGIFQDGMHVGSLRIHAPKGNALLESVDIPLGFYPGDFPAKREIIEISNLCLLPAHRNLDVFRVLYAQVHCFLVEHQRGWIVIGSDQKLAAKYRFIGFRKTRYRYTKTDSAFPEIQLMLSHQKPFGTYGLHADPIRWNLFLREITSTLCEEGKLSHSFSQRTIFGLYRFFSPPARLLEWAAKKRLVHA